MSSIEITAEYSILIRINSLPERKLSLKPFSEDENLLAFGPSFDLGALENFTKRLMRLGLLYWDDFFEFYGNYPPWCRFRAEYLAQ